MQTSTRRFWVGAGAGLIATIVMSLAMVVISLAGASQMPEPLPLALVARLVAVALRMNAVTTLAVVLAIPLHLAYGALWGGVLAGATRQVTWWKGALVGFGLWALMLVLILVYGGAYPFDVTSGRVWFLTLLVHLIYGVTLGMLVDRHYVPVDQPA